jgi:predicted Zn-dependent peptidase
MADGELPLIDLTILVKAGEVDVPADKTGLVDILNRTLINGGTTDYSPQALAEALDRNAIDISVNIGEELSIVRLSVLKEDWETGLDFLAQILTRPAFNEDIVSVAKSQLLVELKRQGGDAQAVAMRESNILQFDGHPYGRDPLKGLVTIPQIGTDDLRRFLTQYVVPQNMVISISGDISKQQAVDGLKPFLARLPKTAPPERTLTDPPQTGPVLALIHKPGQVQSQVVLSLPGIKRTDPDFWKLRLLTDIFGGSDSLMYTRLRDDLGLVYSAGFFQTYKWQAGILKGYIGCKGDRTSQAIVETIQIMRTMQEGVPVQEFELKQLEALNGFVFNVDTPSALVETYGTYQLRNEPLDTLERIQEAYIDASPEELQNLARQYLVPEQLQVVVVADKSIPVRLADGQVIDLEKDLQNLARQLGLPYREIALR